MENGKLPGWNSIARRESPGTFLGIPLKRPAWGILKFKYQQEEKETRPGRHDMVIMNPPLKGLMILMYRNSVLLNISGLFQYYGIPQHYGLFYSMGAALMMEGVLSGCYHVCPNHSNFQFGKFFISRFIVTFLKNN
jgi:hypothetical protein